MIIGPGDTISVAADTLNLPSVRGKFSIGHIIPLTSEADGHPREPELVSVIQGDYFSGLDRHDGELRPGEIINSDISFLLLSLSLLIITLLTAFGRRSIAGGLASITFRKHDELIPAGTSGVFSWPPVLRNIFTIVNIALFAAITMLTTGVADSYLFGGFAGLAAVLAGSFLALLLLRHLTLIVLAETTVQKNLFREYMIVIYNTWFAGSIVLFLLNGIILFTPVNNPLPFIISGFIVVAIFLLIRALRLLSIFHDRHISIFYFLLYLCALEVLPVLVALRLLGVF
jgi:hypothetical protein